jgi:hypothetical protein
MIINIFAILSMIALTAAVIWLTVSVRALLRIPAPARLIDDLNNMTVSQLRDIIVRYQTAASAAKSLNEDVKTKNLVEAYRDDLKAGR